MKKVGNHCLADPWMCLLPQKALVSSASLAVDMYDEIFLFPQPAQLSSKENALVWIAVNEDGVSILDHSTMVWKDEGWPSDPSFS